MSTDFSRNLSAPSAADGLLSRTAGQVRQFLCGLHGHDALLHFEQGRMSLMCSSCGYESPGWDVKGRALRADAPSRVVKMPLVREQRVA